MLLCEAIAVNKHIKIPNSQEEYLMPERKYSHHIVTEDIRPTAAAPAGFLKRLQDQREAGDYLDSFHLLSLNDSVARGALYFDAVWMMDLHGTRGVQVEIQHSHDFDEILGPVTGHLIPEPAVRNRARRQYNNSSVRTMKINVGAGF
jgi:hypothetical protein